MKKLFIRNLIILVLAASMLMGDAALAAENDGIEITLVPVETDENGETIPTETAPEQTAPYTSIPSSISYVAKIPIAGIASVISVGNPLAYTKPAKTEGEIDWELRATALDGYENFGISVVDTYLNVRDKGSEDGNVIGKMTNHNACEILETSSDGKWFKIKSGEVTGWASTDYIQTGWQAQDIGKEEANQQIKIMTETLNVRSEPNTDSEIWTQASRNSRYDVVRTLGDWVEIELDSDTGYVSKEFVEVIYSLDTAVKYTPPREEVVKTLRDRIVAYALKWVGGRYVWGGETLGKGVDCSGFTMKVYQNFGIYMSHYSGDQAHEGTKISRSQLKKGDLIFYAKNGSINHVAIYIGDGQVVHARSTRRGICITDMDYRTPVRYVTFID